ncbi:MAG: sensor histidine kinase [Actinomycetales bacterium]
MAVDEVVGAGAPEGTTAAASTAARIQADIEARVDARIAEEGDAILVGPLGRWAARYPALLDLTLATAYAVAMLALAVVGALEQYTPVAVLGIAQTLTLGAVVHLRRRAPVLLLGVALVVPTLTRIGDSGFEQDPPVVTIWTYDPSAPIPVFDVLDAPRIAPVELVAVAILVLTIALQRPGRTTLVASGATAAYATLSYLFFSGEGARVLDAAEAVGIIAVAALIGTNLRGRLRRMVELDDRARRLLLERDQREQIAVSSERNRIAREMHDVLAHSLSVMVTLADGASRIMDRDPDRAHAALDRLADTGRDALGDTRRMVGMLRDDTSAAPQLGRPGPDGEGAPLAPQPAVGDLESLVGSFHGAGLPVTLSVRGRPLPQDTTLQLTVYRIVQECLTNVLRYAPAAPWIAVVVSHAPGRVTITVDNASGGAPEVTGGSGRGLIGIRERVAVFDGTVHAGPTESGWRVEARLQVGTGTTEATG